MDTREILTDAFSRIPPLAVRAVSDLDAAGLAYRPDPDANSIGWLIWHLARVQDHHVSQLAERVQSYIADGWCDRLEMAANAEDVGYGHTSEQVAAVRLEAPDVILGYLDAVHARTLEYLTAVDRAELARIVDTSWDPSVTAGVRLVSVIGDCMQHLGQANYVRGMYDRLR